MAGGAGIRNSGLLRLRRRNKAKRMRAHKIALDGLLDLRHVARDALAACAPFCMMGMLAHRPLQPRGIARIMARQAECITDRDQVRRVLVAVYLMAVETPYLA